MRVPRASFLLLAWIIGCATQREGPDVARARELIERLRSFDIEERDEAMAALERLGVKAEPALREAVGDQDAEVAARTRHLLAVIEVGRALSPEIRAANPGLEKRLGLGVSYEWTRVFLQWRKRMYGNDLPYETWIKDLRYLAPRAVLGADTAKEKILVTSVLTGKAIRSAMRELAVLATDSNDNVRFSAVFALIHQDWSRARSILIELLSHSHAGVRYTALNGLSRWLTVEHADAIVPLLRDSDPNIRLVTVQLLLRMNAKATGNRLVPLLNDGSAWIRAEAARALGVFEAKRYFVELTRLLTDESSHVKVYALLAIDHMDLRVAPPLMLRLRLDPSDRVRAAAAKIQSRWDNVRLLRASSGRKE